MHLLSMAQNMLVLGIINKSGAIIRNLACTFKTVIQITQISKVPITGY